MEHKMQKKTTSNLEKSLKKYKSLDRFLAENENIFEEVPLAEQLQALIESKGLKRSDVIKTSNLNEVYGYQIISGVRRPSRDKLLCLCCAMGATFAETQLLLKENGFAPLYVKNRRDSIIIFALEHKKTLIELNDALFERGEDILQ